MMFDMRPKVFYTIVALILIRVALHYMGVVQ